MPAISSEETVSQGSDPEPATPVTASVAPARMQRIETITVAKITLALEEAIALRRVDAGSAPALIAKAMEIIHTIPNLSHDTQMALLRKVFYRLAAGDDGVFGTDDDVLPKKTVDAIFALINHDILSDIANVVLSATQGRFNLSDAIRTAQSIGIFGKIIGCFHPTRLER
jgi:hypothetical protein